MMRWLVAALTVWVSSPALADTVRIGLFVGANIGLGDDAPLNSAEDEARDVARIFQDMGALSRDRSRVIQGGSAGAVRRAMVETEAQVREAKARGDDVMLLFYYSGHASRTGLHLGGTTLELGEVRRWLEGSSAQLRIAFVDACESGTLAQTRGGTPTEPISLTVDDSLEMSGLAVITSTGPMSVARESAQFGGGVFSRALMTGLRGTADADTDGVITLDEVYRHAFRETVTNTASMSSGIQRPEYRYDIAGAGDVVLTRIPSRAAGLVLPEEAEGTYVVVSVNTGQVVARVDKDPGAQRRIALPTGRYVVRKVRREDVLVAELDLVWGGDRWVEDTSMTAIALGDPLSRGGWARRPLRIDLLGTVASPFIPGNPLLIGGEVAVSGSLRPQLDVVGSVGLAGGSKADWEGRLQFTLARARAGVRTMRPTRWLDITASGGVSMAIALQGIEYFIEEGDDFEGQFVEYQQWVPGLWAGTGVHMALGPTAGFTAGIRADIHRANVDQVDGFHVDGQALIGLTIGLGGRRVASAKRR